MSADTLARRLGTTTHLSPLLMKARRLGLGAPGNLERLALQRGCSYYDGAGDATCRLAGYSAAAVTDPGATVFSNESLAVALLSITLPHSQHRLRLGAAMTGAAGNSPALLARLAIQERCGAVLRHIALCGRKVEPTHPFWAELLTLLPESATPAPDVLPHITRFVAMTGITRHGRETVMQWIRPAAA